MQVYRLDTYAHISLHGAQILYDTVKSKPNALLGLATGGTPVGLYRELVRLVQEKPLDITHLHTVNLDEYVGLPSPSPQSYRAYMERHLFSPLGLKEDQTHLPDGNSKDIDSECARYERLLQHLGGIDVQLLGVGRNGHIGFNEPDTPFASRTRKVRLTKSTRLANARFFNRLEDVPTHALTMGIATIMEARHIVLLASGSEKRDALYELLGHDRVSERWPVTVLKQHPYVTVLMDKQAAPFLAGRKEEGVYD